MEECEEETDDEKKNKKKRKVNKKEYDCRRNPWRCTICKRKYSNKYNAKNHVEGKHGPNKDVKNYECGVCGKKFATKGALKQHKQVHSDGKLFACKEYGQYQGKRGCHLFFQQVSGAFRCCNPAYKNVRAEREKRKKKK